MYRLYAKAREDNDNFAKSGPKLLSNVDWANNEHQRIVAACLVQGAYVDRVDFKAGREGRQALAPTWWQDFHFEKKRTLRDASPFGVVLVFNRSKAEACGDRCVAMAPDLVIAFRGTQNILEIGMDALQLPLDRLEKRNRMQIVQSEIQLCFQLGLLKPGTRLWLAGHSLGASIATCAGMDLAENVGIIAETFLFNPPFLRIDPETLKHKEVRFVVRNLQKLVCMLLKPLTVKNQERSCYQRLNKWVPRLFVNPEDYICNGFIKYFQNKDHFHGMGPGNLLRCRAINGDHYDLYRPKLGDIDKMSVFLLPAGKLVRSCSRRYKNVLDAHLLHQWWDPNLEVHLETYETATR